MVFFQNIKYKAEFKNLDDFEVLSSDFPDLRTSAASHIYSLNNLGGLMTFTASFHQNKITDSDGWIISGTKMTNTGPFL